MVPKGNGGDADFIYLMNFTNARHFANLWNKYCPSRVRGCDNFLAPHSGFVCRFWASLGVAQLEMEETEFGVGKLGVETWRKVNKWGLTFKDQMFGMKGLSHPKKCLSKESFRHKQCLIEVIPNP